MYYLALFSNRVKPRTVLIKIVLNGDPLYYLMIVFFFLVNCKGFDPRFLDWVCFTDRLIFGQNLKNPAIVIRVKVRARSFFKVTIAGCQLWRFYKQLEAIKLFISPSVRCCWNFFTFLLKSAQTIRLLELRHRYYWINTKQENAGKEMSGIQ